MARPRNIEREERERAGRPEEPLFHTWEPGDARGRAAAMAASSRSLAEADGVVARTRGSAADAAGQITVRSRLGAAEEDGGRGGRPKRPREMMYACQRAYDDFGIVRNIIDTMTDFTVQGISLAHPNPRIQKFYQEWFYKVQGPDVSSHIAQNLFLEANAPVRRHTARLKQKDVDNLQRGVAADAPPAPFLLGKREIPWSYTVMNPVQMAVLGGDLAAFVGPNAFTYAVEIPPALFSQLKRPRNQMERDLLARLPEPVRQAVKDGLNVIPLASDEMRCLYYKRRHWQVWATPMTYPILPDLEALKKLKQADLAALDGAISHIRIWKLGSLKDRMMPTKKAIQKLADMLANAGSGGAMDLIWGPDLDLTETSTEIHRFLGDAKYVATLNQIYAGYGIPPTLTGAATTGGFTNNFISLKTLTERLQYVRRLIREFWEFEIVLVQQAMGFRLPAVVRFDRMVLTDEAAEKALLVQLADRDLISVETIQERFGEDPLIEEVRQRQEARKRSKKKLPQKAGAFHKPQVEEDRLNQFVQQGVVSPSEAGVKLQPKRPGDKSPLDHQTAAQAKQAKIQLDGQTRQNDHEHRMERLRLKHGGDPDGGPGGPAPQVKPKGQPQQGRPRNSKDSEKRKQKVVRVRTKAALMEALEWAEATQRAVAEATTPAYLRALGKRNARQLTEQEAEEFERFKFAVLANLPVGVAADGKALAAALKNPLPVPDRLTALLRETLAKHKGKTGRDASVEKIREYQRRIVAFEKASF